MNKTKSISDLAASSWQETSRECFGKVNQFLVFSIRARLYVVLKRHEKEFTFLDLWTRECLLVGRLHTQQSLSQTRTCLTQEETQSLH